MIPEALADQLFCDRFKPEQNRDTHHLHDRSHVRSGSSWADRRQEDIDRGDFVDWQNRDTHHLHDRFHDRSRSNWADRRQEYIDRGDFVDC